METPVEIASPAAATALEPLTVLVVDDDPPVVDGLSELLEGEGYEVASARDGRAAIELLQRGLRPCVILLDLMMPGMDGWDFRHEQLKDAELREIPVIVVTATGFSESSVKTQLGAVQVVHKPLSPPRVLAAIERACGDLRP